MQVQIADSAQVSHLATIGQGTRIWDLTQVREKATVGQNCVLGRSVYVGLGVSIGSNCKIQNGALIYEPARIGDSVFIGPAVVLTNDRYPRATLENGKLKDASDWLAVGVSILEGASIGAGSICVAPVQIGKWALVGAGSVVLRDVPDFALVAGNPARQIGWVGKAGYRLLAIGDKFVCPATRLQYRMVNGQMFEE
jgi:UDP-2-acetamido-3-amino-2,3-dideoxy-glucuronate N-acetyltransferase